MGVSPQLKRIGQMLASLSGYGRAVDPVLSEEMQLVPTTFDIAGTSEPLWETGKKFNITKADGKNVNFSAFIDGVQRSSVVYWITLKGLGSMVPIVMGHIAAGVTLRGLDKKLRVDANHIRDRILLLMPLKGMMRAGFEGGEIIEQWIENNLVIPENKIAEDPLEGLAYDNRFPPLILCDTTFNNIGRTTESEDQQISVAEESIEVDPERFSTLLMGNNLYNVNKIRGRAQGRINTIRQILEMIVLTKYREYYGNDNYVLVDGPLFFLGKWLRKYEILKNMSDVEREKHVLTNAVGMVKTLKSRPRKMETLKDILNLEKSQYSEIMHIHDAVDIQGSDAEPERYNKPHITTFLRFNMPLGVKPPTNLGLVRVDLHLSTINADTLEEARGDQEGTNKIVSEVIGGVVREKLPGITQRGRSYSEAYPIGETEKMLHSRLYSSLEMKYLYSMIRTRE